MEKIYHVGDCPVCRVGMMEIVYDLYTHKCSAMCDECSLEFDSISDYLNKKNGYREFFTVKDNLPKVRTATLEDIENTEWIDYIIESW